MTSLSHGFVLSNSSFSQALMSNVHPLHCESWKLLFASRFVNSKIWYQNASQQFPAWLSCWQLLTDNFLEDEANIVMVKEVPPNG